MTTWAGTTGEKTLNNFDTDRAFADACKEGVLVLEGSTRGGDFVENVEVASNVRVGSGRKR